LGKHGSYPRVDGDHYPTPDWAIAALAEHVDLAGQLIWEPACGAGRMVEALKAAGATVYCSDVESRGFPLDALIDFTLASTAPNDFNGTIRIISNPAFGRQGKIADRFIEAGLRLIGGGGFLALLLAADFDSGKTRARFFRDCPLFAGKIVLTRRIVWFANPDPKRERPKENHCWFLWASPTPQTAPVLLYAPRISVTRTADGRPSVINSGTAPEIGDVMSKLTPTPTTKPTLVPETPESPETPASEPRDIFDDLSKFRLGQDFQKTGGVKKLLTKVPVRKPSPQFFFRVRPEPAYREALAVIELKEDREFYLLSMDIANSLTGDFAMVMAYTAITRQGTLFLWPIPLPGADGRINEYHRSAHQHAEMAMTRWIRMRADAESRGYVAWEAEGEIADPAWPDLSFAEILRLGFKGYVITSLDHPVVQRLRGL